MARSFFLTSRFQTALASDAGLLIESAYSVSFCFRFSRFASAVFFAFSACCLTALASSVSGSPIIIWPDPLPSTTTGIIPASSLGRAGAAGSRSPSPSSDADF